MAADGNILDALVETIEVVFSLCDSDETVEVVKKMIDNATEEYATQKHLKLKEARSFNG